MSAGLIVTLGLKHNFRKVEVRGHEFEDDIGYMRLCL